MDLVREPEGSVLFGWLAPGVFFARFAGRLSATMNEAQIGALQRAVDSTSSLRYFADCSQLTAYDLMARAAFVRVIVNNRHKFQEVVVWDWSGSPTQNGKTLAQTIGEPVTICHDRAPFEARLALAAPAHHAWVLRMPPDARPRERRPGSSLPRDRS